MQKIVLGGLALMLAASTAMAVDVSIEGKKFILVDKLSAAGKAKGVFVAKTPDANKGTSNSTSQISAEIAYQSVALNSSGSAEMPLASSGWVVNNANVAKYVNSSAPTGGAVKVAVIKPTKLLKAVLKDLGDSGSAINIYQSGATTNPVDMAVQFTVVDGGATRRHCAEFTGCARKLIAAGSGAKVVCHTAVPAGSVTCPASPSAAFTN
jgi:hypothetical protein